MKNITPHEKELLKQIALMDNPKASCGLTIGYDPEIPAKHAGCYMPCVSAPNEAWQNDTSCSKEELDQIRRFADILENSGAIKIRKKKNNENGGYRIYYLVTDKFEAIYKSIDPDGFAEVVATIKEKTRINKGFERCADFGAL